MNGFLSPTTRHWLTSGCARMVARELGGGTFLPPAVTMISFLRPVMYRKPSSSLLMSPVEPAVLDRVGGGLLVLPSHRTPSGP